MFVNGRRVPTVDIQDGQRINIGNPDGPRADIRRRQARRVRRPAADHVDPGRGSQRQRAQPAAAARSHRRAPARSRYPTGEQPGYPSTQQPRYPSGPQPTRLQPTRRRSAVAASRPLPTGARVGDGDRSDRRAALQRGQPRDEHAEDPAAGPSRRGAGRLDQDRPQHRQRHRHPRRAGVPPPRDAGARSPAGTEIRDNRSINGTFVNGSRVDSAVLHEGDTVTIGNVDLVFRGGTLVRRTETTAASGTGGLDVHGVTWTIEGNKTLLDNISITARPGTLTAVIGPSGAGKSTFARLVGRLHPPDHRHGGLRGPRRPRRVRLAALPDRDGAPGRRGARPADRRTRR